jgi:hypothetical protein
LGRAIAQAVSIRFPTAAARVRSQVGSCGICGGQSGTGAGFLRVLRFPLPILIPPTTPLSSGAGTIGQILADVPSGFSLTPPQETKKIQPYYFAKKRRSLGRHSSLADQSHGVFFLDIRVCTANMYSVSSGGDGLQIWRVAANILNKQSRGTDKGWSSGLGVGVGLTTPHRKK